MTTDTEFEKWFLQKHGFAYDGLPLWENELDIWQASRQQFAEELVQRVHAKAIRKTTGHGESDNMLYLDDIVEILREMGGKV